MNDTEKGNLGLIGAVLLGVMLGCLLCWMTGEFAETTYVGEVITYTITKGPYLHTFIELKTYSGSSTSFLVEGAIEPNIGQVIRITVKMELTRFYPRVIEYEEITQ